MFASQYRVNDNNLSICCTQYHVDLLMLKIALGGSFELWNHLSCQLLVYGKSCRSQLIIKSHAII